MMKTSVVVFCLLAGCVALGGCQGRESAPKTSSATKSELATLPAANEQQGHDLANKFLTALQQGDKKALYRIANLTPEILEESRTKLIHQTTAKLTPEQKSAAENALRLSGNIDYNLKKLRLFFPLSAKIVVENTAKTKIDSVELLTHRVKVTYTNKKEALSDKDGKQIKEFVFQLQQLQYPYGANVLQDFIVDKQDYENFMNKKFNVVSYF